MVSKQGRNLVVLVVLGLPIGFVSSLVSVNGVPLLYYFLQVNRFIYEGGWYWQLLTSLIVAPPVYLGFIDVLFNAISLIWIDRLLSSTYDEKEYYAVFIASGLVGNMISLLNGPAEISFGASGGIFGLVGGAVTEDYALTRKVNVPLIGWFLFIFIYSSFTSASVDWLAHLGGSLVGLLAGYLIGIQRRRQQVTNGYIVEGS